MTGSMLYRAGIIAMSVSKAFYRIEGRGDIIFFLRLSPFFSVRYVSRLKNDLTNGSQF